MKVLFIVTTFPALSQTFVLNQIVGLIDRGCQVEILSNLRSTEYETHCDVEKYGLYRHTFYFDETLKTIPKNKIKRLGEFAVLVKKHFIKNPKAVVKSLNVFKHGKEAIALKTFYTMASFIDKGPYDVVHCHFGPNGKLGVYLKEIGAIDGKIITVFHGYDLTSYIRENGVKTYDKLLRDGDLFMPVSSKWKEMLIKLGCEKKKIIVHRMGVDTKNIRPVQRKSRADKSLKLISVARFVEKKGLIYAIRAVAGLAAEYEGISYTILGDGELKDEYVRLINMMKAEENIKVLGWKNSDEVKEHLQNSDVLLAPSVTGENGDQEGIPVVIMEAMVAGLAVISTNHSGIPELVQNGKTGFLVKEKSVEEIKEKIRYLIENPGQIVEMGKEGRKTVEENYDINILNDDLMAIYKTLHYE